jgi:hypothetical protein
MSRGGTYAVSRFEIVSTRLVRKVARSSRVIRLLGEFSVDSWKFSSPPLLAWLPATVPERTAGVVLSSSEEGGDSEPESDAEPDCSSSSSLGGGKFFFLGGMGENSEEITK